jgi:hypothetical protein
MATVVLKTPVKEENIDWIDPAVNVNITLEDYRKETKEAELSGFISFESHKKNMNEWLAKKLQ